MLSITSGIPASCAISARDDISVIFPSGLAKLSANKTFTEVSLTAFLTASKSDTSTKSAFQEKFLKVLVN